MVGHPLFAIWNSMIARCCNPKHRAWHNYGGRGITVCPQWRDDPAAFITWVEANLGPRPEGTYPSGRPVWTLDRWPDNDGPYAPGNLRWATVAEQQTNQRPRRKKAA